MKNCQFIIFHLNRVNKKILKKFSDKRVYFPFPDYGTRKLLFQYYIEKKGIKIPNNFHLSTIAHITEGFTGGNVYYLKHLKHLVFF